MLETNFGVIANLKSSVARQLSSTPPNILPENSKATKCKNSTATRPIDPQPASEHGKVKGKKK